MKLKFENKLFAKYVKDKRVVDVANKISISQRDAAKQVKLSHSTLSRIEAGKTPDVVSFAIVCKWIDKSMEMFFKKQ